MYDVNWPAYLRVTVRHPNTTLRSSAAVNLEVPKHSGTLQDQAAKVFNSLPISYKNCTEYKRFVSHCKKFFLSTWQGQIYYFLFIYNLYNLQFSNIIHLSHHYLNIFFNIIVFCLYIA